jgi:pyochelin synthetase
MADTNLQATLDAAIRRLCVPINTQGTRPPLFLVHSEGGGVMSYVQLSRSLGRNQPVYGIRAAGLDDVTPAFDDIPTMAACYVEAMRKVRPKGPYVLGGWCLGAIIAYEMADQLRRQGEDVPLMLLLDAPNPAVLRAEVIEAFGEEAYKQIPAEAADSAGAIATVLRLALRFGTPSDGADLRELEAMTVNELTAHLRTLAEDDRIDYLSTKLKAFDARSLQEANMLVGTMDRAYLRKAVDVLKANAMAVIAYSPGTFEGAAVYVRPVEQLPWRPTTGWAETWHGWIASLTIEDVPGNHLDFLQLPHVASVADAISRRVDEAIG